MDYGDLFFFDEARLQQLAEARRAGYASASPFPHAVIDDFLPEPIVDALSRAFPEKGQLDWQQFDAAAEKKLATHRVMDLPPVLRHVLMQFNSAEVCRFLETLSGIEHVLPDPHFAGGGLHRIEPGGFLKVHVDFNRQPEFELDRRLNLIVYLNEDWDESFGGHLELWNQDMSECAQRVLPIRNRCVVFSTTATSYHGHPDPLTCPPGRARRSIAFYYYTNGRPVEERGESLTTQFRARPGESIRERTPMRQIVKKFIPPIVLDLGRAALGRR